MNRMKVLFKYVILLIVVYVVSNILIWGLLRVSYRDIKNYTIDVPTLNVTVEEARSTSRDGYIKGKINNITDQNITNKFLKIDLYSERDVLLGTKYIKIENMYAYEIYKYDIDFKIGNVKSFKITLTDFMENEDTNIPQLIINSVKSIPKDAFSIDAFPVTTKLEYPNNI